MASAAHVLMPPQREKNWSFGLKSKGITFITTWPAAEVALQEVFLGLSADLEASFAHSTKHLSCFVETVHVHVY